MRTLSRWARVNIAARGGSGYLAFQVAAVFRQSCFMTHYRYVPGKFYYWSVECGVASMRRDRLQLCDFFSTILQGTKQCSILQRREVELDERKIEKLKEIITRAFPV